MRGKAVIFENDIATIELLAENLERLGFEAIIVSSGLEGVEAVYKNKPQLIFLNPAIGDISDYQICKLLKSKEEYRDIPIIIISEKQKDKLKSWRIKAGADSYLLKPLDRESVGSQLEDLIEQFSKKISFVAFLDKTKQFNEIITNLTEAYQKDSDLNSPLLQKLFQQLIETITSILKSEVGSLMLVDKNSNVLIIKAATGLSEDIVRDTKVKLGESISGWVAQQNRPLLVFDIEKDERFYRENSDKYYTKSFLSVPVKFGEAQGVININNKISKEVYNSDDLNLLLILINQISFAFESSKLNKRLDEIDGHLKKLDRTNKILMEANQLLDKELYETTISDEVNKIVTADLDYRQTVNAVIEIVEQLVDFHFCGLLLVDEESKGELIISIKYPATEDEVEKFKLKVIESFNELTHKMLSKDKITLNRTDGPAIVFGAEKHEDIVSSFHAQLLHNAEKVIGLLAMSHSKKDAFTEDDLKLFSIIAQRSIPAINNAALHRRIKELSNRDGLTGLYCYRFLQEQLEKELKRAERYQEPLGLIMLDIDGFKKINDTHGHLQGDIALKELSSILVKICRNVDIVARYGGEEFMIILPETDRDGAFYLAERIRRVVKNYDFSSQADEPIKMTISLGVVSYPTSATSKSELLKKVDAALYQAKKEGKNATHQT
jgi:diguanylate cyclase (GGDEF)-like protein